MCPMRGGMHEIEVKLPFESAAAARERVERLGARLARPRHFEDNLVLDRVHDRLVAAGVLLRLRRAGGRAVLTLKLPVGGDHRHKVREEHETAVDDADAALEILRGLGFSTVYRYQKHRTVFRLGDLTLCLDETPIGCFLELEGSPDEIDGAAARLGFAPEQYVRENYRELQERAARERGVEASDMLIEAGGELP